MFIRKYLVLLFTLTLLGSASCVLGQRRVPRHLTKKTVTVKKHHRTYYVFVPSKKPASGKFPVVFVFHGGGGTGLRMERWLKFTQLARKEKFIAVYPDGIGRNWNDGRVTEVTDAHREKADDLSFVSKMVDGISKDYSVDPDRVFATGPSNGGIFSHFIGANFSNRFAAIAPVIGGIADPFHKRFDPEEPVSVFIIQGTKDRLVPYGGGAIARTRGKVIATEETVRMWKQVNKTDSRPVAGKLPDTDRNDGSRVETFAWKNGKNGTEVVLYKVIGGGHTWPGGSQYAPRFLIGNVNRDFDATKAIWEFFKRHPKRKNQTKLSRKASN